MNKYVEKIFFYWDFVSFVAILFASEALVVAIDGHFYNDTMLIYMLPLLLWDIRNKTYDTQIRWSRLVAAVIAGAAGSLVMYFVFYKANMAGGYVGHIALKCLYIGAGTAVVYIYASAFFKENFRKWMKRPIGEKISNIILCILFVFGMWIQKEIPIYSLTGWLTAVICFASGTGKEKGSGRENICSALFAGIYACCMSFGNMIHISGFLGNIGFGLILGMVVSIAGWYQIWRQCISVLLSFLDRDIKLSVVEGNRKKRFAFFMLLMLAAWLPYFFGFYPGVLSSDSITQIRQVIGQLPQSNHHPWIHTQLIRGCYWIGCTVLGSANGGVAVYSMVSMILLAGAFAGICEWQCRVGMPRIIRVLSIIFLALCPFNGIYAITMWKDIPFAAFVICFMLVIFELTESGSGKGKAAAYVVLSILVCTFRSNGIYVWIFTVFFLLWQLRRDWKKWAFLSAVAMSVVLLYKMLLLPSLGIAEPDTIESLSIPAQQIACVIAKGGEVSDTAMRDLEQVVDIAQVPEMYNRYSHTSDPIKKLVRSCGNMGYIKENKSRFAKLYIETGLKNPYYYLEAFIEQTKGYWYHKVNDWIYHTVFITDNEINIYRDGKLPGIVIKGMEKLLDLCLNGFHVVWSLALFMYAVLFGILVSFIKKKPFVLYMPLLGVVLTLMIATPRYGDFRYVYPLFAALPLYMGNMVYVSQNRE